MLITSPSYDFGHYAIMYESNADSGTKNIPLTCCIVEDNIAKGYNSKSKSKSLSEIEMRLKYSNGWMNIK